MKKLDLTHISMDELRKDKDDSFGDIMTCQALIKLGRTEEGGIDLEDRIARNQKTIVIIDAEIKRRSGYTQ